MEWAAKFGNGANSTLLRIGFCAGASRLTFSSHIPFSVTEMSP